MNDLVPTSGSTSPFDSLRKHRADGSEFWSARDLQVPFGYGRWEKFVPVVMKATDDINNLGSSASDHFHQVGKMVSLGSGAKRTIDDYELTRMACYLTAMNCQTEEGSRARGYFSVQARRAELRLPVTPQAQLGPYTKRVSLSWMVRDKVPEGYWSVFTEGSDILVDAQAIFEAAGLSMDKLDLLDGSIGQCWPKFRKDKSWAGERVLYPHPFPDHRGVREAWAYLMQEMSYFRRWLYKIYMRENFPEYIRRKYSPSGLALAAPLLRQRGILVTGPAMPKKLVHQKSPE